MDDITLHDVENVNIGEVDTVNHRYNVQHITIISRGGQMFEIVLFSNKGVREDENTHNDKH